MSRQKTWTTMALAGATLLATACNPDDDKVFSGGASEAKPTATLLEGINVGGTGDAQEVTKAASATFMITVIAESGAEMCAGEVSAEIMSNLTFKLPSGKISCASLEIDLTKALGGEGGLGDGGGAGSGEKKGLAGAIGHDGMVLTVSEVANAKFDPPRPMLIGPIIQNPAKYEGYSETFNTSLEGTTADGAPVSGSGSFKVEVFETKTTYYNKVVDEEFKDVMHWKMTKSGFDGIPMTTGLLFESMEFFWNTRPLMIPKVIVRGELGDLISNSDPAASEQTNDLVGVLTINLTIKDYDFDGE